MPKLRRLSGREVVGILQQFGFVLVSQRGSHMKLKRLMNDDSQVLTIPAHAELDTPFSAKPVVIYRNRN